MDLLPYIGSKRCHVKQILSFIPQGVEVVSPFLGAGWVETALYRRGQKVHAYDAWYEVITFWRCMSEASHRAQIYDMLPLALPRNKEEFYSLRTQLYTQTLSCCERTAAFMALNRTSYANNVRSFSAKEVRLAHHRLPDILERLGPAQPLLTPIQSTFETSIPHHPTAFLFADPPYDVAEGPHGLSGARHYGNNDGELHRLFNHAKLAELIRQHAGGFVLTYNDTPRIRQLYAGYHIHPLRNQIHYRAGPYPTRDVRQILITDQVLKMT